VNRREAFNTTINHQEPARILVDFGKHIGSFHRSAYDVLNAHLDLCLETKILDRMAQNVVLDDEVCQRLGIDFRWIVPNWVGVRDIEIDGHPGYVDMWQTPHIWTEVGQYYAIHAQPLGQESLNLLDIENFAWPDPDNPAMFDGLRQQAKHWYKTSDYVVGADGIKVGVLQIAAQLRGYDKLFMDFIKHPDLSHAFLEKITSLITEMYASYMDAVGDLVQVVVITDDQGTQKSLMISPKMFREYIKPNLKQVIDVIKAKSDAKILMHCDGAILPIVGDLIEIGVDILNPVQTNVNGFNDTKALKEQFGDQITFHGAIDVQHFLPNASPEEVRSEVKKRVADLGESGGYILAPCHNIYDNTPMENIVALFESAT